MAKTTDSNRLFVTCVCGDRWVEEGEVLTAFAADDSQIFQIERTAEGEFARNYIPEDRP